RRSTPPGFPVGPAMTEVCQSDELLPIREPSLPRNTARRGIRWGPAAPSPRSGGSAEQPVRSPVRGRGPRPGTGGSRRRGPGQTGASQMTIPVSLLSTAATPALMEAEQRSVVKDAGSYEEDMPSPSPRKDAPDQSTEVTFWVGSANSAPTTRNCCD